ncbi:hypothetical protein AB833_18425 [Chromatiales bacterium (ex Bugula neritina AB1)]|nr:hypothetical protein AB833_18425 [Chromatiales bacterium (ex Bugula neritina AB1)]
MNRVITACALCALLLINTSAVARGVASIVYEDDTDYADVRELMMHEAILDDAVEFINEIFTLERDIEIVVGTDDGPLYDPAISTIQIPYFFYTEIVERYRQIDSREIEQLEFADDAILHTLFHEIAHALTDQLEIPIVGKEEDAADGLASVLLLEYYEDGAEMARNAAELFAMEGEERGELSKEDFWDEHSLDEQRYFSTMCQIYGSDPEKYTALGDEMEFTEDRREICVETYQRLVDDWITLLGGALAE